MSILLKILHFCFIEFNFILSYFISISFDSNIILTSVNLTISTISSTFSVKALFSSFISTTPFAVFPWLALRFSIYNLSLSFSSSSIIVSLLWWYMHVVLLKHVSLYLHDFGCLSRHFLSLQMFLWHVVCLFVLFVYVYINTPTF